MKKVFIGSKNPVKIASTRQAFEKVFPEERFEFIGFNAESDISHQPMTDKETREGSQNRAQNTRDRFPDGDFFSLKPSTAISIALLINSSYFF